MWILKWPRRKSCLFWCIVQAIIDGLTIGHKKADYWVRESWNLGLGY